LFDANAQKAWSQAMLAQAVLVDLKNFYAIVLNAAARSSSYGKVKKQSNKKGKI
jgi:hypothetical protein